MFHLDYRFFFIFTSSCSSFGDKNQQKCVLVFTIYIFCDSFFEIYCRQMSVTLKHNNIHICASWHLWYEPSHREFSVTQAEDITHLKIQVIIDRYRVSSRLLCFHLSCYKSSIHVHRYSTSYIELNIVFLFYQLLFQLYNKYDVFTMYWWFSISKDIL